MKIILSDLHQQFNSTIIEILSRVLFNLGGINGMAVTSDNKCENKANYILHSFIVQKVVRMHSKGKSKKLKSHLDLGEQYFYFQYPYFVFADD